MKTDLDALMEIRGLDALLVLGNTFQNPPMYYLTGGGHISGATLLKRRNAEALLFHQDMEREEAAKTGLKCVSYSAYPWKELLREANGDIAVASALRLKRMLEEAGVTSGKVGVYGQTDISSVLAIFSHLQNLVPGLTLVGEVRDASLFLQVMETKDETEVARIRHMGEVTTAVVRQVADYLSSCAVGDDEILLGESGQPLTIGEVKSRINLWLAEMGAHSPEGMIFAIGREAGIPHSSGTDTEPVRLGQTIVFDIYPCEIDGGYFYDFTRTWSLGYATTAAQQLYQQVKTVFDEVLTRINAGVSFKELNRFVCECFESMGHKTPLHTEAPREGLVHSLGHGVGLNVHERPWSSLTAEEGCELKAGSVFTIEPGLYYPDQGMGVRIEDTFWLRPDGSVEVLVHYPYDFVLEMKRWKQ